MSDPAPGRRRNAVIQVRIRHENDEQSVPLCAINPERLDWLLGELKRWGVHVNGGTEHSYSGQFVVEGVAAFFEIIANDETES
jgi:hypothetical protein